MSKFVTTSYLSSKDILKFPNHFVAIPVTIDDTGIVSNSDGKKIVPAGTIIGTVGANSILSDDTMKAKDVNNTTDGSKAEGVLLEDVDVSYGPASGSMVIHGFVGLDNLPNAPVADVVTALKGRILFIK